MSSRNNPARVAIVMGSKSDWATMQFAAEIFEILDVPHHVEVVSAHRTPDKLFSFAETAEENGYQVIIAGAGGAAHLPGMIAAKTLVPVLGVPVQQSVITAEIERWPETALTRELARHPAFVNRDVFPIIADRLTQKQLFDKLGLATAPWQLLTSADEWSGIFDRLGELAIIKRRVGGYDGRGQWRLRADETGQLPDDCYGECIVERGIHFSGEVSLVGARAHDGSTVFYPLTHNLHQDGILRTSVAFPQANAEQQEQAESMLSAIMQALNYVGVMAMECFITPEGLLINELAPRVHNSGHWTQNGASISQFELHLRAITGLPLPAPVINTPSVMINLIGSELNYDWLKLPLVHLHWYDKAVRPGRKVGHLNLTDSDTSRLSATLEALSPLLPGEYASGIIWAQSKLK